jgi:hypothetical protein
MHTCNHTVQMVVVQAEVYVESQLARGVVCKQL